MEHGRTVTVSTFPLVSNTGATLTCVQCPSASIGNTHWLPADIAAFNALAQNDLNVAHPIVPFALSFNGVLTVPGRGVLKMQPGDVAWADSNGGVGLITGYSLAQNNFWVA
jgi:hypothetical protein